MHTQETLWNKTIYTLQPSRRQYSPLSAKKDLKYTKKHNLLLKKLGEIFENRYFFFRRAINRL